jgi:uncharacterized protein (TIGR02599 family)
MNERPSGLRRNSHEEANAFTIVELLVATFILGLIIALLLVMVNQMSKTWRSTSGKIEEFRAARDAFDTMSRRLSLATLNTYLDYNNSAAPTTYQRQSYLRFLSGPFSTILPLTLATTNPGMAVFFQAPNGFVTNSSDAPLQTTLNTWGYFLEYGSDTNMRPGFVTSKSRVRYRLMELMEPTENFSIYNYTSNSTSASTYTNVDWISNSLSQTYSNRPAHVLAENVIALILLPKLAAPDIVNWNSTGGSYSASSLAPNYAYDSSRTNQFSTNAKLDPHNQLPPVVQVTMVAVDEVSAVRYPTYFSGLQSYVSNNGLFTNAASYTNDLGTLQTNLITNKINYRIFTTDVIIRGAKWSASQTN